MVVIDQKLARASSKTGMRPDGQPAMKLPTASCRTAAAAIHTEACGFTSRSSARSTVASYRAAQPPSRSASAKLAYVEDETKGLVLTLSDAAGKVARLASFPSWRGSFHDRDGGRCGGSRE